MSSRRLTPDERQIWQKVARTVAPRRRGSARPEPTHEDFANMMRLPPKTHAASIPATSILDINRDRKTRRGRVDIDAKIDLHDRTQDEAYPLLKLTLERSVSRGHKCVLVVTGKGARLDGVLRRAFPDWINSPEVRPMVANYAQAHIRHGGAGAWYVFLKRA